jgi:hypothetical protein
LVSTPNNENHLTCHFRLGWFDLIVNQELENYRPRKIHSDHRFTAGCKFWATYCVPCKDDSIFRDDHQKYAKNKVKLLLVSLDFKRTILKDHGVSPQRENPCGSGWLDETDADYFIPRIFQLTGAHPPRCSLRKESKLLFYDRQLKPEELKKAIRKILHRTNQIIRNKKAAKPSLLFLSIGYALPACNFANTYFNC